MHGGRLDGRVDFSRPAALNDCNHFSGGGIFERAQACGHNDDHRGRVIGATRAPFHRWGLEVRGGAASEPHP